MDLDQFDEVQIYELFPEPIKCADVEIKTHSWISAGSKGPFVVDGYGELTKDCHGNPGSECTARMLEILFTMKQYQMESTTQPPQSWIWINLTRYKSMSYFPNQSNVLTWRSRRTRGFPQVLKDRLWLMDTENSPKTVTGTPAQNARQGCWRSYSL
mmetsp:Transcript_586/g.1059  ORF Transcript_586/g.1059 Transcript_586/m.1059 type:complete len:156 (-) Transcript_586:62-529(-)